MNWNGYFEIFAAHDEWSQAIAKNYCSHITEMFALNEKVRLFDFGCGHGHIANYLSQKVGKIVIYDASSTVLERAIKNNKSNEKVLAVKNLEALGGHAPFDLIICNSVIQYMKTEEFRSNLSAWIQLIKDKGKIIVSDVLIKKHNVIGEELSAVSFAAKNRCLTAHLKQVFTHSLSSYFSFYKKVPLTVYDPESLRAIAKQENIECSIVKNMIYNKWRRTIVLEKA